jgi:hypothetical protein
MRSGVVHSGISRCSSRGSDGACGRLNSLFKPSWPDAEKVYEGMYDMVDTLMILAVDQKWFSAFAKIGRMEEMVTSQEIRAVSWGSLFCIFCNIFN